VIDVAFVSVIVAVFALVWLMLRAVEKL